MPYAKDHKPKTRARIVEAARILFNRHGFDRVSIDQVMAEAGLTRGGFYAHFPSKEALYGEAVASFLSGRGLEWHRAAGVDHEVRHIDMARRMIDAYLSPEHLHDTDGQCPLIALSSDVARTRPEVRESYQKLLHAMVWLLEANLAETRAETRADALTIAALCVGGMILARTLPDSALADEVRQAALNRARDICN